MVKFWNFKNKGSDIGELTLYGDIASATWWGDEVTPKDFKRDLDALGDIKTLNVYINSGGGDVFAGQAIHTMLRRHAAEKVVYVDGLAASIASVIAMAGDRIIMPKNAMMMIHNAWTVAAGNSESFRKLADDMDKIDESIVTTYTEKTKREADEIAKWMAAETWMTAEEAVERGFADEIEEDKRIAASAGSGFFILGDQRFDLSRYQKPPEIEAFEPNDSGGESRPVSDPNHFNQVRTKILDAYEKEN